MSFRIEPIRRTITPRSATRTELERESEARAASSNLPVPVSPVATIHTPDRRETEAEFAAQLMGQEGHKRGLRGGQPVLDAARQLYSSIEWSGAWDRRARKGGQTRESI